jgi:hypothetical protein
LAFSRASARRCCRVFEASVDGGDELLRELTEALCSNERNRSSNRDNRSANPINNSTHASRPES